MLCGLSDPDAAQGILPATRPRGSPGSNPKEKRTEEKARRHSLIFCRRPSLLRRMYRASVDQIIRISFNGKNIRSFLTLIGLHCGRSYTPHDTTRSQNTKRYPPITIQLVIGEHKRPRRGVPTGCSPSRGILKASQRGDTANRQRIDRQIPAYRTGRFTRTGRAVYEGHLA